jgi:uncharacterized protein YuzB (UPF0349 family)
LGVASSLANTLAYYAAATGDVTSQTNAKELLDRIWNKYLDDKGVSVAEARKDYSRIFSQEVYIPQSWTGAMPNGDVIKSGVKFIDIRSQYKNDPDYIKVKAAYDAGQAPSFNYHRFWAQSEYAIANGTYAILFAHILGDVNDDEKVDSLDYVLLKKYIQDNSTTIDKSVADINSDGEINILDYEALKQLILSGQK